MQLSQFIDALRADLTAVAAVGDEATAEAAQRLAVALEGSVGLRLFDAFASAALELTAQLPSGRVEVRLSGRDPELVYVEEQEQVADATEGFESEEDGETARITLRLPVPLKDRIEAAAAREGVSVNAWLVRYLRQALTPVQTRISGKRIQGFAKS